jgi:phage terminase large subunit-like protein
MSRRKQLAEKKGRLTSETLKRRAQEEIDSRRHVAGYPVRPQGLPKKARELWNDYATKLHVRRLLATDDADLLLLLVNAKLVGDDATIKRGAEQFAAREPFPEPEAAPEEAEPVATLPDFLVGVAEERASFSERMQPGQSVCLDVAGQPYAWEAGDAAEVARHYALDITQGSLVAGELMQRSAARFLKDLEDAHERGLYFDPVAARHIVRFAEVFCKLKLMPWQVFCLANVFGWKRSLGQRRFTEAFISIARKNGKTALAAIVALWLLVCDNERFPEVYAAATKKEQARIVWKDARRIVGDSEQLSVYVKRWAHELAAPLSDGSFVPLASEEKSMDGLRVHGAIADELHAWVSRDVWDRLVKATVSRAQPLIWGITTAGESKQTFCWNKQDLCEKILTGIYDEPSTFVAIYKLDATDDYHDEACWLKANPSLTNPDVMKPEHLRKSLGEVAQDPSGLSAFLRFHMNVWPEVALARQGSVPAARWSACTGYDLIGETDPLRATHRFLELNRDTPCFNGIDIGLTGDLTAVAHFWPKPRFAEGAAVQARPTVIVQCFAPEVGLLDKERAWGVPLSTWAREGWLELTPGDILDPREVSKYVRDFSNRFSVRETGFDAWSFAVAAAELNEAGYACVAVQQLPSQLTAPCQEFLASVNRGELVHFGNPMLTWMASNLVLAENEKGGVRPEKVAPPFSKIDGLQATFNAMHRALANPIPDPPRMWLLGDHGDLMVSTPNGLATVPPPKKEAQQ